MTFPDWPTELAWIQTQMPVRILFNVATGQDDWVRQAIRGGEPIQRPRVQAVIVQGTREADRVTAALAKAKQRRGLPYGGAISQREP